MGAENSEKTIFQKVEEALQSIRPYLEADGGDVRILAISDEGKVTLELLGACGSCPMSTMTMKAGVEEAIKRSVPQVTSVEAVNITTPDHPDAQLPGRYM